MLGWNTRGIFGLAVLLRVVLLIYGVVQDAYSPVKYTDVDYFVFTDAARFIARGSSPYDRATYRYTPLVAWLLLPTAWSGTGSALAFAFGKVLFAAADILAGKLVLEILRGPAVRLDDTRAFKFASIWLLNPMVATISTRGSSEGLLGVMVVALLWATLQRRIVLSAILLGLAVHFKIYPFIYATSIVWWLESGIEKGHQGLLGQLRAFITRDRLVLASVSFATFMALNSAMYAIYGFPFVQHTFLHHVTRVDHRHNFSPYNILLYLNSLPSHAHHAVRFESLAFVPQLVLSAVVIPLALAKRDLPSTMLAQTFAFVTFNKVCTSQYFLWYIIFLPFYLPSSSLLQRPRLGLLALSLWVATQGVWLHQAYQLEFLGQSTFVPGLWLSSLAFFAVNVWILGIIIADIATPPTSIDKKSQ